ncbi:hypothetical protein [Aliarcobacter vitoriensis]|uniref:DUF983 domain-containing protein n=1 Tax=Aliarcobacter vitoriensis TaxID=2011099 RepID=A0A366MVK8_9BACT|nr:hypothetical protein [Aliarcobacter vitoriensis]RBQ29903.1 hypothetical protein CRU91_01095 [Aliarcobacter vitoriensis]
MSLLTKECEVCGTKISKIKNWYRLVFTNEIKCSNCGGKYNLSKWFDWVFDLFNLGHGFFIGIGIIALILYLITNIEKAWILWSSSIIIYILIKFLIALVTPLKLIESKKEL